MKFDISEKAFLVKSSFKKSYVCLKLAWSKKFCVKNVPIDSAIHNIVENFHTLRLVVKRKTKRLEPTEELN